MSETQTPEKAPEKAQNQSERTSAEEARQADPAPELMKLLELATRYPEIGPPLAELAFKIGKPEIGERVIKLGTGGDRPGVEFHFVTAHTARREKRWADAIQASIDALDAFASSPEEAVDAEDGERLLHLIRLGFSTLLFEIRDVNGAPAFVDRLNEALPGLEPRLGKDPFFRTLLAQALWYRDRERSEAEWDRAAELDDAELTWNARGTWYKEAERDRARAEDAYRKGLEAAPRSALLLHNIAQMLVDRAGEKDVEPQTARRLLNEAEELLRAGLREDAPRVRRHIHATRDRLFELRRALPRPKNKPRGDRGPREGRGPRAEGPGPGRESRGRGSDRPRDDRPRPPRQQGFNYDGKIRLGDVLLTKLKGKDQDET